MRDQETSSEDSDESESYVTNTEPSLESPSPKKKGSNKDKKSVQKGTLIKKGNSKEIVKNGASSKNETRIVYVDNENDGRNKKEINKNEKQVVKIAKTGSKVRRPQTSSSESDDTYETRQRKRSNKKAKENNGNSAKTFVTEVNHVNDISNSP